MAVKCEGKYPDVELELFLKPAKLAKLERCRFHLEDFEVLPF
jgi:hypothetical protein